MHAPDFTAPNEIDGTPREVAKQSLEQLALLADWLEEVTHATGVQVRNAQLSAQLAADPEREAEDLEREWGHSTEAAAFEALALRVAKVSAGAQAVVPLIR